MQESAALLGSLHAQERCGNGLQWSYPCQMVTINNIIATWSRAIGCHEVVLALLERKDSNAGLHTLRTPWS